MTEAIKITDEALLKALGPLPDGYGPDVWWGAVDGGEHVFFATTFGGWRTGSLQASYPVFFALKRQPEKRVVWLNVYSNSSHAGGKLATIYPSRELADKGCGNARIACVRVEFDKGQFDD